MKKSYESKFKSRVALEALRRDLTYNAQRIHSALQYKLAVEVYFGTCNWSK